MTTDPDSIDAFLAENATFLDDPGCSPDIEEIAKRVGDDFETEAAMLAEWLALEAQRLQGETLTVYRHMTVPDVEAFVAQLEKGACPGGHWSDDPETFSHYASPLGEDIRLVGIAKAYDIDWFSTLQHRLMYPSEQEVCVEGHVDVAAVVELNSGRRWEVGARAESGGCPRP